MQIDVTELPTFSLPVVGNVYPIGGGYGRRAGHAMVLIAITPDRGEARGRAALFLVIDKNGDPVGVTSYGLHAIEERAPIAFVRGIEELRLTMEPL
jgi:hypothetical protein